MKRFALLFAFLVLATSAFPAVNVNIVARDSIVAADTANGATHADTAYSEKINVGDATYLHFQAIVNSEDTNFTADKYIFWIQQSWDNVNWVTSHATDSSLSTVGNSPGDRVHSAVDSVLGPYLRLMIVRRDTNEANIIALFESVYAYSVTLWTETR